MPDEMSVRENSAIPSDIQKLIEQEGDSHEWTSQSGWPCRWLRHSGSLHLCGYVGIPKGSRLHGLFYDHIYDVGEVEAHGGLTYSGDRSPTCDPDGNWWVGFDCAHLGDIAPAHDYERSWRDLDATYKIAEFVVQECESLAAQLSRLSEEADDGE